MPILGEIFDDSSVFIVNAKYVYSSTKYSSLIALNSKSGDFNFTYASDQSQSKYLEIKGFAQIVAQIP